MHPLVNLSILSIAHYAMCSIYFTQLAGEAFVKTLYLSKGRKPNPGRMTEGMVATFIFGFLIQFALMTLFDLAKPTTVLDICYYSFILELLSLGIHGVHYVWEDKSPWMLVIYEIFHFGSYVVNGLLYVNWLQ